MSTGSVEVVYRGIFQKTMAKNICRGVEECCETGAMRLSRCGRLGRWNKLFGFPRTDRQVNMHSVYRVFCFTGLCLQIFLV